MILLKSLIFITLTLETVTGFDDLYLVKDSSAEIGWPVFKQKCSDLYFVNESNEDHLQMIIEECNIHNNTVLTGNLELTTEYLLFLGCTKIKVNQSSVITVEKSSVALCVYKCKGRLPIGLKNNTCLCINNSVVGLPLKGSLSCKECSDNQGEICGGNETFAIYDKLVGGVQGVTDSANPGYCIARENFTRSGKPKTVDCFTDIKGMCANGNPTVDGSWIKSMFSCIQNGSLLFDEIKIGSIQKSSTYYLVNPRKYTIKMASKDYQGPTCTERSSDSNGYINCKCGYLDATFNPPTLNYSLACKSTPREDANTNAMFLCEKNVDSAIDGGVQSTLCNLDAKQDNNSIQEGFTTLSSAGISHAIDSDISLKPSQRESSLSSMTYTDRTENHNIVTVSGATATLSTSNHPVNQTLISNSQAAASSNSVLVDDRSSAQTPFQSESNLETKGREQHITVASSGATSVRPDNRTLKEPFVTSTETLPFIIAGCLIAVLLILGVMIILMYRKRQSRRKAGKETELGLQMRNVGSISRRPYNDLPLEGSSSPPVYTVYTEVKKRSTAKACGNEEPSEYSNRESLSRGSDAYVATEDNDYDHLAESRMKAHEDDGTNVYSLGLKPQHDTEGEYYSQTPAGHTEDKYDHVGERRMKAHEDDDTNEYSLGLKPEDYTEEGEYNSPIPIYVNTHLNDGSNVYDTATNF